MMLACDLMVRAVATVQPHETLQRAAALMRDRGAGCVVVVDARARALAMLTDRDVCMAALRTDQALSNLSVCDAMSRRLHSCRSSDAIAAVEEQMSLHQVRRLPVVDGDGRLLGLIALDDIAREACREAGTEAPAVSTAAVGSTLGRISLPHEEEAEGG